MKQQNILMFAHHLVRDYAASSSLDHPPTLLSSHSATPKNSPVFEPAPKYIHDGQSITSQHAPNVTIIPVVDQRATRACVNPPSPPHSVPSTSPIRSVRTSAPYYAPHALNPMDLDMANEQLPAPFHLSTQWTMYPRFRQAVNFGSFVLTNRNQTNSSRQTRQVAKTANKMKRIVQQHYLYPSRSTSVFSF